jgi:hypothetical protein
MRFQEGDITMKMLLAAAGVSAALLYPAAAQASDWYRVGPTAVGAVIFVDQDSITKTDGVVTYWMKLDHRNDRTVRQRETKVSVEVDCANRTIAAVAELIYAADGRLIDSHYAYAEHVPIAPDTVAYAHASLVCAATNRDPS